MNMKLHKDCGECYALLKGGWRTSRTLDRCFLKSACVIFFLQLNNKQSAIQMIKTIRTSSKLEQLPRLTGRKLSFMKNH